MSSLLLFAVDREVRPFLRRYRDARLVSADTWSCSNGRLRVALIGVGIDSATRRIGQLLSDSPLPELVVVAGFAGALTADLPVGAVCPVAEIVDGYGGRHPTDWPADRHGVLFTSRVMIGDPDKKRQLGNLHQAQIVDMESVAIASIVRRHGIAIGCVRVVSDDVHRPLSPRLMTLVETGRVPIGRLLRELLRSPRLVVELLQLARHTRSAAANLAAYLHAHLPTST